MVTPGDPEYGCGGTIVKLSQAGYRVKILYLNRGEKRVCYSESKLRFDSHERSRRACQILGAMPIFDKQIDGEAVVDNAAYASFDELIRFQQPQLIITHWPIDNHSDHRATSMLNFDAWRTLKPNCSLYYYEVTDGEDMMMFSPTDYVDITAEEPIKRKACFAHASQSPEHFYKVQSNVTGLEGLR